jgi:ectoine hydroxylase-related dioxygenase (phytanoyl-CoA dioxygenase family)
MLYPEIDYSLHPAYLPYQGGLQYDEQLVRQLIKESDYTHAQFCALASPSNADAEDALSQIQGCMGQVVRHSRERNISLLAEEWLNSAIQWTISDLSREYARLIFSARDYRGHSLSSERQRQLLLLQAQGMYIVDMPADAYADIRRLALLHRDELRQRALLDPVNRAVISTPFNSALWKAIKHAAKEAGIFEVLSELKQNRMTLLGAGLEYSCPEQNWHQSLYADIGLSDSPLQYLHVDEGECLPKSMIYVTPVEEENGATRAIPASNLWERSECLFRMHKALDNVVGSRYANYARKGSYRPLARYPELRRIFMELPKPFQGSSHFGDDILSGTKLASTLANLEVAYLGNGGHALVFDGPHLLHRGSIVRSGERMAIQVVYRNQNEESIKGHLSKETLLKDQIMLAKKYARKFVKSHL